MLIYHQKPKAKENKIVKHNHEKIEINFQKEKNIFYYM